MESGSYPQTLPYSYSYSPINPTFQLMAVLIPCHFPSFFLIQKYLAKINDRQKNKKGYYIVMIIFLEKEVYQKIKYKIVRTREEKC